MIFFKFSFNWSSPIFSSLSSSFRTFSVDLISTLLIIEERSVLLLICISMSGIFRALRISETREMISASAFISAEPMMSASHCVNWRKRDEEVGSSLKIGPIW